MIPTLTPLPIPATDVPLASIPTLTPSHPCLTSSSTVSQAVSIMPSSIPQADVDASMHRRNSITSQTVDGRDRQPEAAIRVVPSSRPRHSSAGSSPTTPSQLPPSAFEPPPVPVFALLPPSIAGSPQPATVTLTSQSETGHAYTVAPSPSPIAAAIPTPRASPVPCRGP